MNPKNIKVGDKLVWLDPDNMTSQIVIIDAINEEILSCTGEADCDVEVFDNELHTLDSILCCEKCGNIDVESKAWIFTNSSVFNQNCHDLEHWCNNGCGEVNLKTVKQYLDEKLETSING